jgi:8-oxo-dGTP pyrophosphatase MutT (NUDIX family)
MVPFLAGIRGGCTPPRPGPPPFDHPDALQGRHARQINRNGAGDRSWCGGHIEFGETLEACAIREVHEESGLVVKKPSFLCLGNLLAWGKHDVDVQLLAEDVEGEPVGREPSPRVRLRRLGALHVSSDRDEAWRFNDARFRCDCG